MSGESSSSDSDYSSDDNNSKKIIKNFNLILKRKRSNEDLCPRRLPQPAEAYIYMDS